ncbi:uncharacterized protein BDR25DRAFT_352617 [Lindgomyces ingoldianus]|uniref:Uncharacterized protein n=1 Tax=Lindgomyces ingoldianus TaxID=673940 RepID=A0ACB6R1P5_9PLEO|nr:uncharacterized protein BDR25DRAFT_352617 [Lindgomyces ingoldianus]KAF2473173.1 hypothetical protein BDR25DRAFT_352617 [Lindgomyces ingoldianus]
MLEPEGRRQHVPTPELHTYRAADRCFTPAVILSNEYKSPLPRNPLNEGTMPTHRKRALTGDTDNKEGLEESPATLRSARVAEWTAIITEPKETQTGIFIWHETSSMKPLPISAAAPEQLNPTSTPPSPFVRDSQRHVTQAQSSSPLYNMEVPPQNRPLALVPLRLTPTLNPLMRGTISRTKTLSVPWLRYEIIFDASSW